MGCDFAVIWCDPERSDAQTLCDVPDKACVTLFKAAEVLSRIINTVFCQLDKREMRKIQSINDLHMYLPLGRVLFAEM